MGDGTERRPGRPKGKPLSDAEIAQRRTAAWKHGQDAQRPAAQLHGPCKETACPLKYPCEIKRAATDQGLTLDRCALSSATAPSPHAEAAYLAALESGDSRSLDSIVARGLGQMATMFERELELLGDEGLRASVPVVDREGNVVDETPIENPRARNTFKLAEMLGITAGQAGLTRKAKAEIRRDDEIGGLLGFVAETAKERKRR